MSLAHEVIFRDYLWAELRGVQKILALKPLDLQELQTELRLAEELVKLAVECPDEDCSFSEGLHLLELRVGGITAQVGSGGSWYKEASCIGKFQCGVASDLAEEHSAWLRSWSDRWKGKAVEMQSRRLRHPPAVAEQMSALHMESLVCAMSLNAAVLKVQIAGCNVLASHATDDDASAEIGRLGGVGVVHAAIRDHGGDVECLRCACKTLRRLSWNAENRERIGEKGGVQLLYHSMVDNPEPDIQRSCCGALWNLALDTSNWKRIGDLGGVDILFQILRERILVLDSTRWASDAQALTVHEAHTGVMLVHQVMQEYVNDEEVQWRACAILQNLAINDHQRMKISLLGGVGLVHRAMRKHPKDSDIQRWGCGALGNLARSSEVTKQVSGGLELIDTAMRQHQLDAEVQKAGCAALWNMALDHRISRLIGDVAVDVIHDAMRHHPKDLEVQRWGCGALWNLALDDHNLRRITEQGGVELVRGAICKHPADKEVQRLGNEALSSLVLTF